VAGLRADVVVDLVCFRLESATPLVDRLRGEVGHLPHCGSAWRYGPSRKLPISEDAGSGTAPVGEHGIEKDRIARMLKAETASGGLATTSLHPGHMVGPDWHPIGPRWFGQTARLETITWKQFGQTTTPEHVEASCEHLFRSHCLTIDKAIGLLGSAPRHEPEQAAVLESVRRFIEPNELRIASPLEVRAG
jgi:hypothetical protein